MRGYKWASGKDIAVGQVILHESVPVLKTSLVQY